MKRTRNIDNKGYGNDKEYMWVFFIAFIILIPLGLNWLLGQRPPFNIPVVGDSLDWLMFWATYSGAVASFLMVLYTSKTLRDTKRQWLEEQRPRLNISVIIDRTAYFLRIYNSGKSNAYNIKISINDDFINIIPVQRDKQIFISMQSSPFFIGPNENKYFFIGICEEIGQAWKGKNVILKVKGEYCDRYLIDQELKMDEFINKLHFVVNDPLTTMITYLKEGLVVQNDQYYPIQKSLDIIAKQIVQINKNLKKDESE